jgi:uncharacterized membrane protein
LSGSTLPACGARSSLWDAPASDVIVLGGAAGSPGVAGSPGAANGGASAGGRAGGGSGGSSGSGGMPPIPMERFQVLALPEACTTLHNDYFVPTDLSGDGQVLVGYCSASFMLGNQPPDLAFRWSNATGYESLLPAGSMTSRTSYSGAVTAGIGTGSDQFGFPQLVPIHWLDRTAETLSTLKGEANAVSGDGTFTFGDVIGAGATRWRSATSFANLQVPSGSDFCSALDTNRDGSVAIELCTSSANARRSVVLLRASGELTELAVPAGATDVTGARLSADGLVVAGMASDFAARNGESFGFRWTEATGTQPLDANGDTVGVADLNADGSVIVGQRLASVGPTRSLQVLWTPAGRTDVESALVASGADLEGWSIETVNAISDDGQIIVGTASADGNIDHTKPFLARFSLAR